ncbi:MAG: four helix bundle protein, partial [Sphingobacteriales bacterium 12-47-4]
MFLLLAHTKLDIFHCSKDLIKLCYEQTRKFPVEEKYCLAQQIRRAALSVHLNIAEGCSRKSVAERRRFFEIARGSIVEVDTALDIAVTLCYISKEELENTGDCLTRSFSMISKMMQRST